MSNQPMKTLTIGETTYEIIDDAGRNRITNLEALVSTPLIASTVSAMIDTSKIYVYTGSETGYTTGNWYYWNGTAWTSGGIYNYILDGSIAEAKLDSELTTKISNKANLSDVSAEATTRANADTALSNQIAALQASVGSPLTASTASVMTDTTKIYVYVGSETGYTSGNWYYYDGSAWVSGGVYNAVAVNIDDTLTIQGACADAKAAGDEIGGIKNALDATYIPSLNLFQDGVLNTGKQWNCWMSTVYKQDAGEYSCGEFDVPSDSTYISSNFYWANNSYSAYVDDSYNKIGLVKDYYDDSLSGYRYAVPEGATKVCFSFNSSASNMSQKLASSGIVYVVGSQDIASKTVDDYLPVSNFYADKLKLQSESDKTIPEVIDELQGEVGTNWAIKANLERGWTNTGYLEQDSDANFERVIIKLDKSSPLTFTGASTSNQYFYYLLFADADGNFISEGKRTQTGNTTDTVATSEYPSNAVYAQITYNRGKAVESTITNGNITQIVTSEMLPLLRKIGSGSGGSSISAQIVIPDSITAVVGDTLQIYYDSIVKSTEPVQVMFSGTKGKAYERYFEYTPTVNDVGETTMTIYVKKYTNIDSSYSSGIVTKTFTLKTVTVPSSPSSEKHILCVGDSTIVAGDYVKELARRLCGTGGTPTGNQLTNLKFTGRLNKTVDGMTVGYEGFSGWSWNSYISSASKAIRFYVSGVSSLNFEAVYQDSNGCRYNISEINVTNGTGNIRCIYVMGSATTTPPTSGTLTRISGSGDATITYTNIDVEEFSPFVVDGDVDFTNYVDEYCDGTVDYALFSLGTNVIINSNAEFSTIKSTMLNQMDTLIGKLHEQYPSAVVMLCTLQKGSMRGGFGNNFGTAYNADSEFYNHKVYQLNQAYIEFASTRSYVKLVDVSGEFDTLYSYPHTMKAVNVRDSENTEMIDTNFGHPSTVGYMQMADAMYRAIANILS